MSGKIYQQVENAVLSVFAPGTSFVFDSRRWVVAEAAKPSARSGGEGKTDIYVLLADANNQHHELKISVKASTADWYENKMSQARFAQIFTTDERRRQLAAQAVAKTTALAESGDIILSGDDYVVLGYKLDIIGAHATGHTNSFEIELTEGEAAEVISGSSLDAKKRNSSVNGDIVADSGAASHLVHASADFLSLSAPEQQRFVFDNIVGIDDHVSVPENRRFRMKLSALSYGQRGSVRELSRKLFLTNRHIVQQGRIISWVDEDQDLFNRRAREVAQRLGADVRAKILL